MAVYTHVSNEDIDQWLGVNYVLPPFLGAEKITQGVENSNYILNFLPKEGSASRAILTLYEQRVRTDDLPYFLGLMQHIARNGLSVPQPIAQTSGALWGVLAGKMAAITRFLPGANMAPATPVRLHSLGGVCAQLHQASAAFALRRENDLSPFALAPLVARCGADGFERIEAGLSDAVAQELAWLTGHQPRGLPSAHIHADLFPDNVFFDGEQVSGLIDFYFACYDSAAYELAVVAVSWCMDEATGAMDVPCYEALLAGYAAKRPLSSDEQAALPVLLRGAALRFFLTRAHDWIHQVPGAQVVVKDPNEYLRKWRWLCANAA